MPYIGKSPSAGVRQRYQYTATAGQTTFTGTDLGNLTLTYTDNNFVDVFQNGVLLKGGGTDYTATSGTSVVLTTGASVSDVIEIIVYDVFSVGNFFNRTDSDSRYVNVSGDTMTGSLDLNGTELVLDADADTSITADTDDQVDIKIGGTDRFSIASTGATTITTAGNESTLSLVSTDADASLGPVLDLHRNSASPADDDAIGRLVFSGENDASEKIDLVKLIGLNSDVTDGTEDGRLQLYIHKDGSGINRIDFQPTVTVFNDDSADVDFRVESDGNANMLFVNAGDNAVLVGKTSADNSTAGQSFYGSDGMSTTRSGGVSLICNRLTNDGQLVNFRQDNSSEGNISVSGSTVSYNGFSGLHESSGIATNTPIGTVVSTIDELDVYALKQGEAGEETDNPKAGQTRADHAKVKVSDTAGDKAVYGVVGSFNAQEKVNVASVGIGSVRVTGACAKGDLLESNGDGTAKVQSDDIVRSKTIGKVTIGNSDTGVKLVSCVLYCG
jgi:hypothetical protein